MIFPILLPREFDSSGPARATIATVGLVENNVNGFAITLPAAIGAGASLVTDDIFVAGFRQFTIYVQDNGASRLVVAWAASSPFDTSIICDNTTFVIGTTAVGGAPGRIGFTFSPTQGSLASGHLVFSGAGGLATSLTFLGPMVLQS
jgi:hypothetical protein